MMGSPAFEREKAAASGSEINTMRNAYGLRREEHSKLVVHGSLQVFPVQRVAAVCGSDLAELNVLDGLGRDHHHRRRNRHQLRAASHLQGGEDTVHLSRNGGT